MTTQPGDLWIDFSGAAITAAQAKKDGAVGMFRYSAGVGNAQAATQWKLCKDGEIPAAEAAGEDFCANCEWYESRITEGASAGGADGAADLGFWKARGLARGATIYVSWDAAPDPSLFDAVAAYLKAYGDALAGHYKVGLYAGTPALREMLRRGVVTHTWRPNAGSWSNDGLPYQPKLKTDKQRAAFVAQALAATPANVVQTGNYWYSKGADEDIVVRAPIGSHLEAKAHHGEKRDTHKGPHTPPTHHPKPKPKQRPWRWLFLHLRQRFLALKSRKKGHR